MRLEKHTTPVGYSKTGLIFEGEIIETRPLPNGDIRFLVFTGNGHECKALYLSVAEIAAAVTGAVVDAVLDVKS